MLDDPVPAEVGPLTTANTVPPSWLGDGLDEALKVVCAHPLVTEAAGLTACHDPLEVLRAVLLALLLEVVLPEVVLLVVLLLVSCGRTRAMWDACVLLVALLLVELLVVELLVVELLDVEVVELVVEDVELVVEPVVLVELPVVLVAPEDPVVPNHSNAPPPLRLQSLIFTLVKLLADATLRSKYAPEAPGGALASGLDPYMARVKAPNPVAVTVTPPSVVVAVPPAVADVALAEAVAPAGGPGGVGAVPPAAVEEVVELLVDDVVASVDDVVLGESVLEVVDELGVDVDDVLVASRIANCGVTWLVENCPFTLPK